MNPKIKNQLHALAQECAKQGQTLHVVGGTLRDRVLRRTFHDIDLVSIDAHRWAQWFAKHLNTTCVTLHNKPGQEVFRIPLGHGDYCDLGTRLGSSLEDDLACRDFTINSMAQPLTDFLDDKNEVIDPFCGMRDLKENIIRMLPGNPFRDDPLRLLRAFRQAAVLQFEIEPDTLTAISREAPGLKQVSEERISQELLLFFNSPTADISGLVSSGLLAQLMQNAGIDLPCDHTLFDTWKQFQEGWDDPDFALRTHRTYYENLLETDFNRALSGMALTLFSFGKDSAEIFMKHYRFSKRQAETVFETIQLAEEIISYITSKREQASDALLYQWTTSFEPCFPQGLLVAAVMSAQDNDPDHHKSSCLEKAFDFFQNRYLPASKSPPLISGNDLQTTFNLKPSPLFKTLLAQIREAQILGRVSTKEQAGKLLRQLLKTEKESS